MRKNGREGFGHTRKKWRRRGGWGGRKDNIDIPGETRAQIRVTQDGGG